MNQNNRYIIICQARTGSTMLSTALNEHPDICAHGEVLNTRTDDNLEFWGVDYRHGAPLIQVLRNRLRTDPEAYLREFVFQQGNLMASGFKFKYEEMSNPCFTGAFGYVLRNTDIKVIHVKRKNLWKRFLSEYIALHVTKTFNATDKAIEVPEVKLNINPKVIERAFRKSNNWMKQYTDYFSSHAVQEYYYEDFMKDPAGNFNSVTEFLGVPEYNFEPRTKKIKKKQKVDEMLTNYGQIVGYFKGSEFANFFESDVV